MSACIFDYLRLLRLTLLRLRHRTTKLDRPAINPSFRHVLASYSTVLGKPHCSAHKPQQICRPGRGVNCQ